jgi:prophage regulatory protein
MGKSENCNAGQQLRVNACMIDESFWWLMRLPEVAHVTARSARAITLDVQSGTFPPPIRVGENSVRWLSPEVFAWIDEKVRASKNPTEPIEINAKRGWRLYKTTSLPEGKRFLRMQDVMRRTGKSRASIYKAIKIGRFPSPITLSDRRVAWLESDVNDFVRARLIERNKMFAARVES